MKEETTLTLSRKTGESFRVGDAVILVKRIAGNRVHFSTTAPRDVRVLRTELDKEPKE